MDLSDQKRLLNELASDLEAGEDRPLTPIVRKAARLAASLGEKEYRTLFQLHLDGIGPSDQARAHQVGADIDPVRRRRALRALLDDRAGPDKMVVSHPLVQLEEVVGHFHSFQTADAFKSEYELRPVLARIRNRLGLFVIEAEATLRAGQAEVQQPHGVGKGGKIFIGHGRSSTWTDLRDFLRDQLNLDWTEFTRDPAAGLTVTERLEQMLNESIFAFLVMTADDAHEDGSRHARENVVHEIGLCQGRMGRKRAIVLLEDGCAEFSNILGLVQLRFTRGSLLAQSEEIRRVLEREGVLSPGAA
jgi:hypothetical protein